MNTRTLLNLVLAALTAFLAWIVFYEPGAAPEAAPPSLTSIASDSIQTLRVVHQSRPEIQLERTQEGWFMTAPLQAPADESKIETLLSIAQTPSHSRYPSQDLNLAKLGLDPPEAQLRLDSLAIAFGSTEPLKQRRYILLEDTVHLISDTLFETLIADAPSFVNPELLPGDYPIVELRFPQVAGRLNNPKVSPKHTITLRQEQGTWSAEGTVNQPSNEAIAKLVKAWQQHTAEQVELKGDRATLATIEIQREGAPPIHFELLATLPRLTLARPDLGIEYRLFGSAWGTLFQLPQD